MKFRYYIFHLPTDFVRGTNDAKDIKEFSDSEEYVVIDVEIGKEIEHDESFWIMEV